MALRAHEVPVHRLDGVKAAVIAEKLRGLLPDQFLVYFIIDVDARLVLHAINYMPSA